VIPQPSHRYCRLPHLLPLLLPVNLLIMGLLLMGVLAACGSTPEPTPIPSPPTAPAVQALPSPTVTATPVRTSLPTAPPTVPPLPAAYSPLTGPATLSAFVLPLPENWVHLVLTPTNESTTFQPFADANPALQPMVDQLFQGHADAPALLVAWSADGAERSGLIAYTIPRRDLTLPGYQRAVERTLSAEPTTTLHQSAIHYELRDDVPVGYLHYTRSAEATSPVEGYHYALFNTDATELLLLTFVTSVPEPVASSNDEKLPRFATFVQQLLRSPAPPEQSR